MSGYKILKDYLFCMQSGSVWGTAMAQTSGTKAIITDQETVFNLESTKHRFERLRGLRMLHEGESWNETGSAVPTITMNNVMMDINIDDYLNSLFPQSGSWLAVSNIKTWYPQQATMLPLYKSNQGTFYTILRKSPDSNDSTVIASAIVKSAKFKIHPVDNDAVLMADFEFLGNNLQEDVDYTGNIRINDTNQLYTYAGTYGVNAVLYNSSSVTTDFISAEINIDNGAKYVSDLPNKEIALTEFTVNGNISLAASSTTDTMKQDCMNSAISTGKMLQLDFGAGSLGTSGDLRFLIFCKLNNYSTDLTEGEILTFDFEGIAGVTGSYEYPCVIRKRI